MYELSRRVAASHTNSNGRLKFVSAIDIMQDCSQLWLESEPKLAAYFAEHGIAQFLVSRQVDVLRMPCYGERLSARTSVFDCQSFLGFRNTAIYDEAGLPCLVSWSTGAFVDIQSGRPARLPETILASVTYDQKIEMNYADRKIILPADCPAEERPPQKVCRHDIDFNRHVNNARYVQLALEYPEDDFVLSRFRVEYKRPAQLGDTFYPRIIKAGDKNLYVLLNNSAGEPFTVMELIG